MTQRSCFWVSCPWAIFFVTSARVLILRVIYRLITPPRTAAANTANTVNTIKRTTPFCFDAEIEIARCLEEEEELDRAIKKYQELKKEAPDNKIIDQGIERVKKRMDEKKK